MSEELDMCTEGTTKFLGPFQILDEVLTEEAEKDMTKNTDTLSHEEKGTSGENTIVEKELDLMKDIGEENKDVESELEVKEAPSSEIVPDNFIQQNFQEEETTSEEKISCEVKIEKEDIGEESTIVKKESETEKAPNSENEFHKLIEQNHQEEKATCNNECEKSNEETINCEDKTGETGEKNTIVEKEPDINKAPKAELNNFMQQNPQEENKCERQSPEETVDCEDKTRKDLVEENTNIEKELEVTEAPRSETEQENSQEENESEKQPPKETASCEDKTEKEDMGEENTNVEKALEVKETPKSETEHNKLTEENLQEKDTTCEKQSPEEIINCEQDNENISYSEDTDQKCPEETNITEPFVEEVKDDPTHAPQEDEKSVKSCHTEEGKEDSISVSHEDEISVRSSHDDLTIDLHEESDVAISENVDDCDKDEEDQEEPMNCHPYSFVIENFELTKEQKMQTKIGPVLSLRVVPVRMVSSRIGLLKLLPALNSAKEIALKAVIDTSHFETTIQLLAISTRDKDYIIDVGKLNKELLLLTEIFINPKIVKIIYCSERVLSALQNILHLYLINIFDCERAGKVLETGYKSIDMILQKEYSYPFVNGIRQVDYRSRPLSAHSQDYCRAVPHYLIYMYHDYKNKLLSKDENLYKKLMDEFRETSKIIYPNFRSNQLLSLEEDLQNRHKCQLEVLEKLNEWRNDTAIKLNKNPFAIMPKVQLLSLSSTLPVTEFSVCCISKSPFVKDDVEKILVIIREAKRKYHLDGLPITSEKKIENLKYTLLKELDKCTSEFNSYQNNMMNKFEKSNFQKAAKIAGIRNRPGPKQRKRQHTTNIPPMSQQNSNYKAVNNDYSPGFNYFKQAAPVRYNSQKASSSKGSPNKWNDGATGRRNSGPSNYNQLKIQKGKNAFKRKFSSIQTDEDNYSRKKRN